MKKPVTLQEAFLWEAPNPDNSLMSTLSQPLNIIARYANERAVPEDSRENLEGDFPGGLHSQLDSFRLSKHIYGKH
jgi:hypothetical protein